MCAAAGLPLPAGAGEAPELPGAQGRTGHCGEKEPAPTVPHSQRKPIARGLCRGEGLFPHSSSLQATGMDAVLAAVWEPAAGGSSWGFFGWLVGVFFCLLISFGPK